MLTSSKERLSVDELMERFDFEGLENFPNEPSKYLTITSHRANFLMNLQARLQAEGRDLDSENKAELKRLIEEFVRWKRERFPEEK